MIYMCIHYEMINIIKLVNISITSYSYHFLYMCVAKTYKAYLLAYFKYIVQYCYA